MKGGRTGLQRSRNLHPDIFSIALPIICIVLCVGILDN